MLDAQITVLQRCRGGTGGHSEAPRVADAMEVRWAASPISSMVAAGSYRGRKWGRRQMCPMGSASCMGPVPLVPTVTHFTSMLLANEIRTCIGSLLLFFSRSTVTPWRRRRKHLQLVLTQQHYWQDRIIDMFLDRVKSSILKKEEKGMQRQKN